MCIWLREWDLDLQAVLLATIVGDFSTSNYGILTIRFPTVACEARIIMDMILLIYKTY
jgi:hypothetical protein